ncbi:MAG: hypothetical protein U1E14_15870 [Geminicoccaceae bacterium]
MGERIQPDPAAGLALLSERLNQRLHSANGALQLAISNLRLQMRRTVQEDVRSALAAAVAQLEAVQLQPSENGTDAVEVGAALARLASEMAAGFEDRITIRALCTELTRPSAAAEAILEIAQEALTNALRHAFPDGRCGTILVVLETMGDDEAELRITDDGAGAGGPPEDGVGTALMRRFARRLGGTLTFEPGQGYAVRLRFPLRA